MASGRRTRPPLQLQFTVQGGKRVLPLTEENVEAVFKTGVLTKQRYGYLSSFAWRLGIPEDLTSDPASAAAWWITHGRNRRWRCIIYTLDNVGETDLADELMPYSEPPSDPSLTTARVTPILMELEKWNNRGYFLCGTGNFIPESRAYIIRRQHSSIDDQKKEAASYYVACFPHASWDILAKGLWQAGEKRAIEAFKAQLPKPKDPSLTVEAMMTATEGVTLQEPTPGRLLMIQSDYLDMAPATYDGIVERKGTGEEGRRELLSEFLSHHPYPRWELIIKLLERLEREGKARAGLAQEVKEKYLTSVRSLFTLCVGHIVNNYEFYQPLLPQLLPHHIHTHITSFPAWQWHEEKVEAPMPKRQKVCVSDEEEEVLLT